MSSLAGVEDPAAGPFEERRAGCGKRVISESDAAQMSVYRLEPGCGVPAHWHTHADDLFVGLEGEAIIRAEGVDGTATFTLRAGACCHVTHGVRHQVINTSATEVALFVLVHTPYKGFDLIS